MGLGLIEVREATAQDAAAISALMEPDSQSRGGSLFGDWGTDKIARWIDTGALILLAVEGGRIVAVLFTAEKGAVSTPAIDAMWQAWPSSQDAYVYGPVCLAAEARGRGVLALLADALRARRPGREAVLFINRDNPRSITAHLRIGVRPVAEFSLPPDQRFQVFILDADNQPSR